MATKLEQQIDKALAVLAAHTRPVRYIVRKPRPAGKGRAKRVKLTAFGIKYWTAARDYGKTPGWYVEDYSTLWTYGPFKSEDAARGWAWGQEHPRSVKKFKRGTLASRAGAFRGGKGRVNRAFPVGHPARYRRHGAFPPGYLVTRPRDPRTNKVLWDVTAPNGEWVGEFPLRRSALLMARRHNQRAGFGKLRTHR